MTRVGIGYDLHRLAPGRRFVLGGVTIPSGVGPEAHSDGDVLAHAVIDALLGGAALGNIGQWFPDTDAQYKDADSIALLRQVVAALSERRYAIVNLDANVVLQTPKLNPHLDAVRRKLAEALGIDIERVSVKAKTNECVGPEGRGEAVSAQCVVMISIPD